MADHLVERHGRRFVVGASSGLNPSVATLLV